jgi:hypothetical protein
MPIRLIRTPIPAGTLAELAELLGDRVRLALDVGRGVIAAGGEFHADCEEALLDDGSDGDDIWGLEYWPGTDGVSFVSLINIKPQVGNRTTDVQDPTVRSRLETLLRELLGKAAR